MALLMKNGTIYQVENIVDAPVYILSCHSIWGQGRVFMSIDTYIYVKNAPEQHRRGLLISSAGLRH